MGGPKHVNAPVDDSKADEMDTADKVTETTESVATPAEVIPESTPISEPVIDELAKPEGFSEPTE